MNRCFSLKGASAFLCCVAGLSSSLAAKVQSNDAIVASDVVVQAPNGEKRPAAEGAHNAQGIARQIAEKARDIAKRADDIAAAARRAGVCGPAANRSGLVSVCADDGARYYGEMKEGRFQGLGVYVFANGYMIKGEWKRGEPEGLGVTISDNGYLIEGEMRAGKATGYGVGIGTFGRYEGEWKDGTWSGLGVETRADTISEGEWRNGTLQH